MTPNPLTMFSFGYWGAGSVVDQLVAAVEKAEAERGYGHPLWVDIRIRREGRAKGFKGDALQNLLGSHYEWMQDLGNESVLDKGERIRLRNPGAAADLLARALEDRSRRVLFFCACEVPNRCHRRTVSKLLVSHAKKRGLDLCVTEWPGGDPDELTIDVAPGKMNKARQDDLSRVPLPKTMSAASAARLPWGSVARLVNGDEESFALVGPARFESRGPYLQVALSGASEQAVRKEAARWREREGYAELFSAQRQAHDHHPGNTGFRPQVLRMTPDPPDAEDLVSAQANDKLEFNIANISTEQILAAFQRASRAEPALELDFLRAVSQELGCRRMGARVQRELKARLRTALRRGILVREGKSVRKAAG